MHSRSVIYDVLVKKCRDRDSIKQCHNSGLPYDKEKYKEMLLDAVKTVLGIFGFERTLFGKQQDKKWWMELRRNVINDVKAEAGAK